MRRSLHSVGKTATDWTLAAGVAAFAGCFALARWLGGESLPTPTSPTAAPTLAARIEGAVTTPDSAPKSVRQPIRDAFAGEDPMAGAGRMLAWLETTTAETFRELAENPEKFPVPHFSGFDREFRTAYFDAIAARWIELDPEGALPAMQRVHAELGKDFSNERLLDSVAKVRPELVLEKLPLGNAGGYLESYARVALSGLAVRDLKAARLFAERCTDKNTRAQADGAIIFGVAESDPVKAATLALEGSHDSTHTAILREAEKMGPAAIRQVIQTLGNRLAPYSITPEFAMRHPDLVAEVPQQATPRNSPVYLSDETLAAADRLSPEEREHLLADPERLPANVRASTLAAVVSAWGRTEPRKAAEWAVAHGKIDDGAAAENTAAQQVFLRWIHTDVDAALAWWRGQPASPLRDALGTNASTFIAEEGRMDVAMELFRPSKGDTDEIATRQIAQMLAARDVAAAAAWFAKLPSGVVNQQTARTVVNAWYEDEPEKVARWVESLPAGKARDEVARAFIAAAARQSPAGAAEWVETVADPELRTQSAAMVFWQMQREDPKGARKWLGELRGVDVDWQARTLRRQP